MPKIPKIEVDKPMEHPTTFSSVEEEIAYWREYYKKLSEHYRKTCSSDYDPPYPER